MDILRTAFCRLSLQARGLTKVMHRCTNSVNLLSHKRVLASSFHTTGVRRDLMEFFDEKDNWGSGAVLVGRPWKLDELRIKSNSDLHKLWYVLLKERNMLMTMQHYYEVTMYEAMPHAVRMEKVEESMENLLSVVEERNVAYNLLETGTTGQPEPYRVKNFLGLEYRRRPTEHYVPKHMNKRFRLLHPGYQKWMRNYLKLYTEKKNRERKLETKRVTKRKRRLLEVFPNLQESDITEESLEDAKVATN